MAHRAIKRRAMVINIYLSHIVPFGDAIKTTYRLEPHLLVGWVLLAHGETVGHGALRHKNAPPLLHPRPSGVRTAKKSAPFLGSALLQSRSEPNDYFLQQSPLSIADNIQMAFSCSAINPVRRSAVAASFASKLVRRVRSSSRRKL